MSVLTVRGMLLLVKRWDIRLQHITKRNLICCNGTLNVCACLNSSLFFFVSRAADVFFFRILFHNTSLAHLLSFIYPGGVSVLQVDTCQHHVERGLVSLQTNIHLFHSHFLTHFHLTPHRPASSYEHCESVGNNATSCVHATLLCMVSNQDQIKNWRQSFKMWAGWAVPLVSHCDLTLITVYPHLNVCRLQGGAQLACVVAV